MKLTQLEYFCTVARYRSITKAANELYVSQPAISNAIRALEEEFGINLFIRHNNKLTLTAEGEQFFVKAEELLSHAHAVSAEFQTMRSSVHPVTIGIPPLLSTVYFPDLYLGLKSVYPDIPIKLIEYGSLKACALVLEDQLDMAIVNAEQESVGKCSLHVLDKDELLFCVGPSHPLSKEKRITLNQLQNEPLILFNTDSVQTRTLLSRFQSLNITPNIILQTSQLRTIINFLLMDHTGAFLYRSVLNSYPDLIGIPIDPPIFQNVGLIWKTGKYQSTNVQKVIRYIRNY